MLQDDPNSTEGPTQSSELAMEGFPSACHWFLLLLTARPQFGVIWSCPTAGEDATYPDCLGSWAPRLMPGLHHHQPHLRKKLRGAFSCAIRPRSAELVPGGPQGGAIGGSSEASCRKLLCRAALEQLLQFGRRHAGSRIMLSNKCLGFKVLAAEASFISGTDGSSN